MKTAAVISFFAFASSTSAFNIPNTLPNHFPGFRVNNFRHPLGLTSQRPFHEPMWTTNLNRPLHRSLSRHTASPLLASLSGADSTKYPQDRRFQEAMSLAAENPKSLLTLLKNYCVDKMPRDRQQALIQTAFAEYFPEREWISKQASYDKMNALLEMAYHIGYAVEFNDGCSLLAHDKLPELIANIASLEKPEHRAKMILALEQLAMSSPECQHEFNQFTQSLSHHGLMQAIIVLELLYPSSLSDEEKQVIVQDYGNKGLKNVFKQRKVLDFLFDLEHLPVRGDRKAYLLKATAPSIDDNTIGKKQLLPKLLRNINLMQVVMQLVGDGGDQDHLLLQSTINHIGRPADLEKAIQSLGVTVMGQKSDSDAIETLANYLQHDEQASHLLVWAAKQRQFAKQEHDRDNQQWIRKIADWLIADSGSERVGGARTENNNENNNENKTENRHDIRNDIKRDRYSHHRALKTFEQRNPIAYRRWCELEPPPSHASSKNMLSALDIIPGNLRRKADLYSVVANSASVEAEFDLCEELDESEKMERLMALGEQSDWRATVTSDLQSIFRCGTLVPGSCQHVSEKGLLNQGLIGFIIGGKMAAIWQDKKLLARNMLFLGWDPKQQTHVIVMASNMYGQPECDEGHRQLLKLAANEYANWLGLELVDAYRDERNIGFCSNREIILPLNAPTYIDGHGIRSEDTQIIVDGLNNT